MSLVGVIRDEVVKENKVAQASWLMVSSVRALRSFELYQMWGVQEAGNVCLLQTISVLLA